MRLTLQTDYALRMLVYLAIHQGRASQVTDVAANYGFFPQPPVESSAQARRTWLPNDAVRPRRRHRAGRASGEINLSEEVRQMEDGFARGLHAADRRNMRDFSGLPAERGCRQGIRGVLLVFDAYTLTDIAGNRTALLELVDIPDSSTEAA